MGWLSLIVALPRLWTAQATAALVESHDRLITGRWRRIQASPATD